MEEKQLINLENIDLEKYYERIEKETKKLEVLLKRKVEIEKLSAKIENKVYEEKRLFTDEEDELMKKLEEEKEEVEVGIRDHSFWVNDAEASIYSKVVDNIINKDFLELIGKKSKTDKDIEEIKEKLERKDSKLAYYICDYIRKHESNKSKEADDLVDTDENNKVKVYKIESIPEIDKQNEFLYKNENDTGYLGKRFKINGKTK